MSDLISRQAVKEQACMFFGHEVIFANKIDLIPSTDRSTGHIVTRYSGKFNPTIWAECSECEKPIDAWDKFCRHCGAKMKGGEEE